MSEFDVFAGAFAAPALVEQFGDRDTLLLKSVGREPLLVDAILSHPRFTEQFDPQSGDVTRVERRTAMVSTSILPEGLKGPEREMEVVEIASGAEGKRWTIDLDATMWGPSVVTLGLMREPLLAQREMRRGEI